MTLSAFLSFSPLFLKCRPLFSHHFAFLRAASTFLRRLLLLPKTFRWPMPLMFNFPFALGGLFSPVCLLSLPLGWGSGRSGARPWALYYITTDCWVFGVLAVRTPGPATARLARDCLLTSILVASCKDD